jgi:hypothetical protein
MFERLGNRRSARSATGEPPAAPSFQSALTPIVTILQLLRSVHFTFVSQSFASYCL